MTSVTASQVRDSIVASIPACHAGDRGSIPRHGSIFLNLELHFVQQLSHAVAWGLCSFMGKSQGEIDPAPWLSMNTLHDALGGGVSFWCLWCEW